MVLLAIVFALWMVGKLLNNYAGIALKDHYMTTSPQWIDMNLVKRLQKLWHRSDAFVIILLSLYIFHLKYAIFENIGSKIPTILTLVVIWSIWWVLFDIIMNKLRGHAALRVGTSAGLDKSIRLVAKFVKVIPVEIVGLLIKIIFITALNIVLFLCQTTN